MRLPEVIHGLRNLIQKGLDSITAEERTKIFRRWLGNEVELDEQLALTRDERAWLASHREVRLGVDPARVLAIGDSDNDREMLQQADIAVIVMRPDGTHLDCSGVRQTIKTAEPGPAGWNTAVEQVLQGLDDLVAAP